MNISQNRLPILAGGAQATGIVIPVAVASDPSIELSCPGSEHKKSLSSGAWRGTASDVNVRLDLEVKDSIHDIAQFRKGKIGICVDQTANFCVDQTAKRGLDGRTAKAPSQTLSTTLSIERFNHTIHQDVCIETQTATNLPQMVCIVAPHLHFLCRGNKFLNAPGKYTGTFPMAFRDRDAAQAYLSRNRRRLSKLGELPAAVTLPATSDTLGKAGAIWLDGYSSILPGQQVWRGVVRLGGELRDILSRLEAK